MDKTDKMLSGYQLIPLSDITPAAKRIAVLWVEGFEPTGGIDIQQKHKLASDIMNYASQSSSDVRKELEEARGIITLFLHITDAETKKEDDIVMKARKFMGT